MFFFEKSKPALSPEMADVSPILYYGHGAQPLDK
jgi:hypothetical protein